MTNWRGLVPRSCDRVELATPPTFVLRTDQLVLGDEHVGEEDLVELGLSRELHQRSHLYPGVVHVDDQIGDPLVFRRVLIAARQADSPVGELCVGRPDLLPVHHPPALDPVGPGAQGGEIAARSGLAEQLAPEVVGGADPREPARLLLLAAAGEQRGGGEVEADAAHHLGGPRPGQLLLDDEVLGRSGAPSPVRFGPGHADPAAGGEGGLPGAQERHLLAEVLESGREPAAVLPREVLHQPGAHLSSERFLFRRGAEVHEFSFAQDAALP